MIHLRHEHFSVEYMENKLKNLEESVMCMLALDSLIQVSELEITVR